MRRFNESGSHIVAASVGILVLAVIVFAGYIVFNHSKVAAPSSTGTSASATVPATITNTTNLNQAGKALDSSSSQLNGGLNDSSLDSDLNSML